MRLLPKWGLYAALVLIAAGIVTYLNVMTVKTVSDQISVYVANKEIPIDTPLKPDQFSKKSYSEKQVPDDALTEGEMDSIDGKMASVTVLEGQVLVKRMVSGSQSIRDVVKSTGRDYIAISIPLDTEDMPLDVINNGDVISFIGVGKKQTETGDVIESRYAVENVQVIKTVDDSRSGHGKILVLVPRAAGPEVVKYIRAGKYNVALDPHPFDPEHPRFKVGGVEYTPAPSAQLKNK